jgi:hypothetical protein
MKQTSIKAYGEIKEDGTLARLEKNVLELIKTLGPLNGRMVDRRINGGHKRIAALLKRGCITEAYAGVDKVTGKATSFYRFVRDNPLHNIISVKKPTYKELEDKIKFMQDGTASSILYDTAFIDGWNAACDKCIGFVIGGRK